MALSEATKLNLRRKSEYVDRVQQHNGKPLWSWLDLNLTELCNRKCVFCPRVDEIAYPNQRLHMTLALTTKISEELHKLDYSGVVVLCGFGEPMLHPQLPALVSSFGQIRVELVTNGDMLTATLARELVHAGLDYFVVSLYDGPHQVEIFKAIFAEAGLDDSWYILRDRWHNEEDSFGLKLTNRAGTVSIGQQDPVDMHHACYYLTYQMTVDWNGDVLLCPQDWHKRIKYGNIATQLMTDIWTSPAMHKRRMQLIKGRRTSHPCHLCNTDGTLHGFAHVKEWVNKGNAA